MINFQVPQIYHKQKNIHESVNHSKSKALPVLQTDLHLEEEEGRALWFKSEARMNSAAKFCALLTLWAQAFAFGWAFKEIVVELYIKPNHQKLGNKWRQKIENQNNADFVTKSRADWTNPRSIFNCLKTWRWNSVPNSRHNFELYNVTWKNLCPSDEVRMYVCNSQTLKLDLRLNWSFSSGGGSNSWRNRLWLFWWIVKFCFWNTKFHHGVFHLHHRCKTPGMLIPAIQILFHMQKLTQRQVIEMHTSSHSIIQQFCRHTGKKLASNIKIVYERV